MGTYIVSLLSLYLKISTNTRNIVYVYGLIVVRNIVYVKFKVV
nr:MAG TPA: hypothetical protein [Caudoviricetes sp.]